jgi:hypothetical protein
MDAVRSVLIGLSNICNVKPTDDVGRFKETAHCIKVMYNMKYRFQYDL